MDIQLKNDPFPIRVPMSPELRLILACLRFPDGRIGRDDIGNLLRRGIDFDFFVTQVERHRVVGPVYTNLKRLAEHLVPGEVLGILGNRCQYGTRQVLIKAAELVRIVKRFKAHGVRALPLKGSVVAMQAYGDLGSRQVGDLDILVSPEQAGEAERILLQEGYGRTDPDFALTPGQRRAYIRSRHHFGYLCRQRGVKVELHWRLDANRHLFPVSFSELWRATEELKIGGSPVPALSPEYTLLLLCAHGSAHGWIRLFWLNDVAHLMGKHHALDWCRLMGLAEKFGIRRMVAEGVLLAHLLLGVPLPEPARLYIHQDQGVLRMADMSLYLMNHCQVDSHRPFTYPYYCERRHLIMLRRDLRYRLAFWARMLGTGYLYWERIPLPDTLFALYYPLKPFAWFFKHFLPNTKIHREGPMNRG